MKKSLIALFALIFLTSLIAAQEVNIIEFYSLDCPHCINVEESGILEKVAEMPNITLTKYNVKTGEGYEKYLEYHEKIPKMPSGWPLVIVESENQLEYLLGDGPIINNLEQTITDSSNIEHNLSTIDKLKNYFNEIFNDNFQSKPAVALIGLIIVALIDAINPCAFGVLIFLMIALLNTGSRKRALRYGLIYSAIIFITYFLAGFALFNVLQRLTSARGIIYLIVGIIVLILGLIEFHDYLQARKGKDAILRISPKIKPFIEKKAKEGTLLAIMALGIIVALFELPCTGGVYLPIITLLQNQIMSIALFYLVIYNLVFILPLIIITLLVYKGMSPEIIQKWNTKEKAWMRLAASLVMILISIWLIGIGI
jgi:cytochrome c biogenesis protein CcdA